MYIPFDEMPGHARLWIFQTNRLITDEEASIIKSSVRNFVDIWMSHGASVTGSFDMLYNRFILIVANENANDVGGCSIDNMVHYLQTLGAGIGIDFMNRDIAYLIDNQLVSAPINVFKSMLSNGEIDVNTQIFVNNLIRKSDLKYQWKVPVSNSWLSKYLPQSQKEVI
ncbi:MAG: hypothetical protein SFY32_14855 [Bacteroidota bacterium]|nr:hypothetical protein [Bacteroidota bacterium]